MMDGLVGMVAWWVHRQVGAIEDIRTRETKTEAAKTSPDPDKPRAGESPTRRGQAKAGWRWTGMQGLIGGAFLVSGAVAMVYEVGWFRLLALVLGPSVHAFSVMLAVFLVGIGLGSVAAARWAERTRAPLLAMAGLEAGIGFAALGTMAFYNELPGWYFRLFRAVVEGGRTQWYVVAQGGIAAAVVLLPTIGMGALFPVVVRAFREASKEGMGPEESVGRLYVLNTVGGIVGSLAGGFLLVPGIGMWKTVLAASAVSVGLGLILWMAVREVTLLPKMALAAITASHR